MTRPDQLLAAAALALGALAVWPWIAPALPPASSTGAAESIARTPAIAAMPPLATYAAVFERPLFSPSRRPPAEGKAPAVDADAGRYRLLGLLAAGKTRRALIADGNRRIEVGEGATLGASTVARIEHDRVVLSSPSGQSEMRLRRTDAEPSR